MGGGGCCGEMDMLKQDDIISQEEKEVASTNYMYAVARRGGVIGGIAALPTFFSNDLLYKVHALGMLFSRPLSTVVSPSALNSTCSKALPHLLTSPLGVFTCAKLDLTAMCSPSCTTHRLMW